VSADRTPADPDPLEALYARGVTDGLPVVPATAARVAAAVAASGRARDELIALVAPRLGRATVEKIAINAVMAGCRPEYLPAVIAGVEAICDPDFALVGVSGTTDAVALLLIINGPVRAALDVNSGAGAFGPGWRANATIGRALRLVIRNGCRAVPGVFDRASFSTPARYAFCFGEDEEDSPWTPMHVERGFAPDQSAVTVHSTMTMLAAGDYASRTPEGVADTIIATMRRQGSAGDRWLGDETNVLLVVGPEQRRIFTSGGWSKADFRAYAWDRLQAPPGAGERPVKLGRPEGLLMVAAGGPGMPETWIMFPHLGRAITEPVVEPAGA
jgi:hypothetical protein